MIAHPARPPPRTARHRTPIAGEFLMSNALAQPVTFECTCGTKHNAPFPAPLPPGWTCRAGKIRCHDCSVTYFAKKRRAA